MKDGLLSDNRCETAVYRPIPKSEGGWRAPAEGSILLSFELINQEGEGPPQIATFQGIGQRRAFTPAVILFIALPESEDKYDPG